MKVSKYYPFAFIYFFLNSFGLPFGLLYTIILTPLFYVWIVLKGKRDVLAKFAILFAPFVIIHFIIGVDHFQYLKSFILYFTVYIFCYTFYTLITSYDDMEELFYKLVSFNFVLTLIAVALVFTSYRYLFWHAGHWNANWPRLVMLTYEASYYSTLLVPIFAYYYIKIILGNFHKHTARAMLMIVIPLLLSLSLGVIAGLIISASILFVLNVSRFLTSKKLLFSFLAIAVVLFLSSIVLIVFYEDNPLFVRLINFVAGDDQSGRGRTTEAFVLAYEIADLKSIWWGVGPGQLKIIGDSVIKSFYNYPLEYGRVSIPNAFAETLAIFGFIGAFLRLFVELYLFHKTKVLNNYYRTFLFFYMFVYQFTGSFTTNIAEYIIWILAFTNIFPRFNKSYQQPAKLE